MFQLHVAWAAVAATGMILGAIYLLTLVQKVFWGAETVPANRTLTDINGWELAGAFPLVVLIVLLGVFPRPLLTLVEGSVKTLQRAGAPVAPSGPLNRGPAAAAGLLRLDVHELAGPGTEAAR